MTKKQSQRDVNEMVPDYKKESKLLKDVKIDFDELRSLRELGVDTSFLNVFEKVYCIVGNFNWYS